MGDQSIWCVIDESIKSNRNNWYVNDIYMAAVKQAALKIHHNVKSDFCKWANYTVCAIFIAHSDFERGRDTQLRRKRWNVMTHAILHAKLTNFEKKNDDDDALATHLCIGMCVFMSRRCCCRHFSHFFLSCIPFSYDGIWIIWAFYSPR